MYPHIQDSLDLNKLSLQFSQLHDFFLKSLCFTQTIYSICVRRPCCIIHTTFDSSLYIWYNTARRSYCIYHTWVCDQTVVCYKNRTLPVDWKFWNFKANRFHISVKDVNTGLLSLGTLVFSCSNTGSIRNGHYWTSRKNSLGAMQNLLYPLAGANQFWMLKKSKPRLGWCDKNLQPRSELC